MLYVELEKEDEASMGERVEQASLLVLDGWKAATSAAFPLEGNLGLTVSYHFGCGVVSRVTRG